MTTSPKMFRTNEKYDMNLNKFIAVVRNNMYCEYEIFLVDKYVFK